MRNVINWLSEDEISKMYTSDYWNNIEIEKQKEWWIADGQYERCMQFLKNSNLLNEFELASKYISELNRSVKVLDLAAGIGWTSCLISKINKVEEVHAVEMSKHRIGLLFDHSVKMLEGVGEKIFRYLGSFYNLKFGNASFDVIFLSQAFHHADKPLQLLIECDRVLKRGGRIIVSGEPIISFSLYLRRIVSTFLKTGKLVLNFYKLFPPESIGGDHFYRQSDYYFLFQQLGYSLKDVSLSNKSTIYIADKI